MKKIWFVECQKMTLGKGASLPSVRTAGTRQRFLNFFKKNPLCRVLARLTLDKEFKKIKK